MNWIWRKLSIMCLGTFLCICYRDAGFQKDGGSGLYFLYFYCLIFHFDKWQS